jgi:signal transduction histidine kinase
MRRIPVRLRVTLVFTGVMAAVLVATGLFLYDRLRADLDDSLNQDLRSRSAGLASAMRVSDVGLGEAARSIIRDPRQGFSQVLTTGGKLFDPAVQHGAPVIDRGAAQRAARGSFYVERPELPGFDSDPARLFVHPIRFERRTLIVVVGASLAERDATLSSLRTLLLIGGPIALLLAALAAYGTVAAAMRPVEAMRARAAEISSTPGEHRLPVPPARDELQRLGETLNEMLERLDESIERERSFVDDASHELRTPLALHRTELELALRYGGTREELRASIASAIEDADRLAQLADDLLVMARADKDGLPIRTAQLELSDLFSAVRERAGSHVAKAGRSLDVEPPDGIAITGDSQRLEQALGNLIDNAIHHGAGAIRLWARPDDTSVELHVSDEGPGFPPDFLPHAFERFRRADAARGEGGTGLGLAIVQAIAAAHGGQAGAANRAGAGADVWIEVPRG